MRSDQASAATHAGGRKSRARLETDAIARGHKLSVREALVRQEVEAQA
ncbi:MAG: hypothetical protein IPP90_23050 [Gemmatimonadaceae bacterium]|nr:hypothetical protein [Gemmatimonadaceae bacterium]